MPCRLPGSPPPGRRWRPPRRPPRESTIKARVSGGDEVPAEQGRPEADQVLRRGSQGPGGPGPRPQAGELRLRRVAPGRRDRHDPVLVPGHEGVLQAEGVQDPLPDLGVGQASRHLADQQAEQRVVGVGVVEVGSRGEHLPLGDGLAHHRLGIERVRRQAEAGIHGVVPQAGPVGQEVAHGQVRAQAEVGEVGGHPIVEAQRPLLDELHHDRGGERLGGAADHHGVAGGQGHPGDGRRRTRRPPPRRPRRARGRRRSPRPAPSLPTNSSRVSCRSAATVGSTTAGVAVSRRRGDGGERQWRECALRGTAPPQPAAAAAPPCGPGATPGPRDLSGGPAHAAALNPVREGKPLTPAAPSRSPRTRRWHWPAGRSTTASTGCPRSPATG